MSSAEPLVSVIIPVLNGERHLGDCMRSVFGQTYENIEVAIANNASNDRTAEIIGTAHPAHRGGSVSSIGRIHEQTQNRPLFIVRDILRHENPAQEL